MNFLNNVISTFVFMTSLIPLFLTSSYANDNLQISSVLTEANSVFSYKDKPIHPALINEFQNSLADYRPPMIVSVDVGAAYESNQYFEEVKTGNERIFIDFEEGGRFAYQHLGKLENNIHVLFTWDITTGTGVFQNLTFVRFMMKSGYDRDGLKPSNRLIMTVVRIYNTRVRSKSEITIKKNSVIIKNNTTLNF